MSLRLHFEFALNDFTVDSPGSCKINGSANFDSSKTAILRCALGPTEEPKEPPTGAQNQNDRQHRPRRNERRLGTAEKS